MIDNVTIYKEGDKWIVEVRGNKTLLHIMTNDATDLVDGSSIGRWCWETWEQARQFVFGPPYANERGLLAVQQRAWMIRNRQEWLDAIMCDCGAYMSCMFNCSGS